MMVHDLPGAMTTGRSSTVYPYRPPRASFHAADRQPAPEDHLLC